MAEKKNKKNGKKETKKLKEFFENAVAWVKGHPLQTGGIVLGLIIVALVLGRVAGGRRSDAGDFQTVKIAKGDLIAIVGATGVVEANQSADLRWESNGRVAEANFGVGDMAAEGDVLAELAANSLPQNVILAQADLVDAQKALDDLVNSNTESATAYTNLLEAEQDLREAEDDRDQWNFSGADMDRIMAAREDFLDAEEDYKDAQIAYELVEDLADDDPEKTKADENLDEMKLKRDKALRTLNYIIGRPFNREVAEDFADYDVAKAALDDAQREWERVKDGPNKDDILAAEAKVAAAEATVSLGKIEAPFGGTITKAEPKAGDQVNSGDEAFRLDDLSALFIEVEISEVDINRVAIGQKAELSFDAILGETFDGEVVEVSSVGIDSGSGVDFQVRLKVDDPSDQVRPGMTAAVNIIVSEINDVLTIPNRAVRLVGGQRTVFILKNGKPTGIDVQLGASSDTHSEVIGGDLKAGDTVVLNPPMEAITGQPAPFMQ